MIRITIICITILFSIITVPGDMDTLVFQTLSNKLINMIFIDFGQRLLCWTHNLMYRIFALLVIATFYTVVLKKVDVCG